MLFTAASSYSMINAGLGFVTEVKLIPWFDLSFMPVLFGGNHLLH